MFCNLSKVLSNVENLLFVMSSLTSTPLLALFLYLPDIGNFLSSDAFWLALGSVGGLITLFFIYYQIRMSKLISAADFLLKFEDKFNSNKMRRNRKKLMSIIKDTPDDHRRIDASRDVLDFFDDLAVLMEMKVISKELLWSEFCYWVLRYQALLKEYIAWLRKDENDMTLYVDFENMCNEIRKVEEKERQKKVKMTSSQLQEFIKEEMQLE